VSINLPLLSQIQAAGLPPPVQEYRFNPGRLHRFDFAWPERMLGVEVDGGTWSAGRHTRGAGFERDVEKLNAAAELGWVVLRFTTRMVEDGRALATIQNALKVKP
jgi:very-short-patch-repair endonuclease